ncbi:MAG: sigma-54-dependent transcriptional regulator [Thermoanaerobaculia bacterium]
MSETVAEQETGRGMVLIVDDDSTVTASLALLFRRDGYRPVTANAPAEAEQLVARQKFALILQDMNFSRSTTGEEGLGLLARIRAADPDVPVILMTAWGSIGLAVEGMKLGATDFVTKPWSNAALLRTAETALGIAGAIREKDLSGSGSRAELDAKHDFGQIVGDDPKIVRLLELIARIAPTDASVLITGESGTGKELVAEAIHRNSRRRNAPFVKVNLGGISSTLFESEMFGHVRGAFTDAKENRKGRFEMAEGGTIFLDEIGEIDPNAQVKLLRVLQDRTFEILGSSRTRTADIRVISATNQDLAVAAREGRFREDLLYRLNLITMKLPALRERKGDIPVIASRFLALFARAYGRERVELTARASDWLVAQSWPGNVRQLRQVIERAILLSDAPAIDVDDLLAQREVETREAGGGALPDVGSMTLDEMEKAMIAKSLSHYDGNLTRVAEALGLSRGALYRRLEKYGFDAAEPS